MAGKQALILVDQIEPLIQEIRGRKVLLDRDLAAIYGVATRRPNEQVRRNHARFPDDFVFRLNKAELDQWKSQIATSNPAARMGLRKKPLAFTEHGAIMAASVLNSPRAVEVSVYVVRAFVKLRQLALGHKELAAKLAELDRKVGGHDHAIRELIAAIRQLTAPPAEDKPRQRYGFARDRPLET